MQYRLVLASGSPRRKEILQSAGLPFTVRVPNIEERRGDDEQPDAYVQRLAREKARAIEVGVDEVILGADTTVVLEAHVLEKPQDGADAARMLGLLSGREHQVMTGICLRTASKETVDLAVTLVRFAELTRREIDAYVASGEPNDKAGAYAIQGLGSKFVERIEGCYFNIVGLPISLVYRQLKEIGFSL